MPDGWSLSPELRDYIGQAFREHGPDGSGTEFFPAILWSLGGTMRSGETDAREIPPHYSLAWIKQSDLSRFINIQDEHLRIVAFQPKREDANVLVKVVDFIDGRIDVR